jgi:uncharacterized membrane protein
MIRRLGNFFILSGLICLVIFFTSSAFILDEAWFLLSGLGLLAFGLLLRRASFSKRKRRAKRRRRRKRDADEEEDE